jgi:D-lactate dehydrogenase (cytochrome)
MQTKTGIDELQNYLTDASNMQGGTAEKLFIPESAEEVAAILREANEAGIPVTVSGARTGTVGGAVPFGGYIVSLERFNQIKSIDKNSLTAVLGPGVVLADFQKAVDAEGLFYAPDPTEWSSQMGGTVATNASGARSFKYGATRSFVKRLEVVLADGEMLDLRRGEVFSRGGVLELKSRSGKKYAVKLPTYRQPDVRKNTSGYFSSEEMDAVDLFIGSEGTLGVVTEMEVGVLPKPESFFGGIVFFAGEEDLLAFVREARAKSFETRKSGNRGLDASFIEYFDDQSLRFISEKFPDTPTDVAGAIFFEQETDSGSESSLLEAWNALFEKHNADLERSWFTTTDADMEKMRAFRHALPVSVNERIVKAKQKKVGTDMAVPDANFASFLKFYKETLKASGLEYVIFGHIGDNHLHANMLPKDAAEAEKARHLYGRFIAQAIMLGGTVSAEHGIGKHKSRYLYVQYGERYLNEMAEVKRCLDPNAILGRGNMLDEKFLPAKPAR